MSFGASSFLFSFFVIRSAMTGRFDKLSDLSGGGSTFRSLSLSKRTNRLMLSPNPTRKRYSTITFHESIVRFLVEMFTPALTNSFPHSAL